ncbi:uncharacterized protein LOC108158208 [Drosophila miranda]|uniref:uncharacterized protein LOC108158208 n=1 Tax=Drosophila miranda TaxID=7229 RepID=UPI0007E7FE6C|nr:uncharacterized protein LOC108158208 [Drosophila miranda]
MKKNYLVVAGIGCLISVMPFIVHAMPPLLSGKNNTNNSLDKSGSHVRTQSWVSNAIQLEMMSTKSTGGTARDLVVASNISGYGGQTNNTESDDWIIRLFPAAFQEDHQSGTKLPAVRAAFQTDHQSPTTRLPEPHTIKKPGQRVGPKNDGHTSTSTNNITRTSISQKETDAKIAPDAVTKIFRIEETTDSWPVNPWGGLNFKDLLKGPPQKQKRSRTKAPTWAPGDMGVYSTIYWWYPVLTDNPNWKYIPDRVGVSQVCRGKSTLYNVPKVYDWLKVRVRNRSFGERPIFMPLRKELYTFGLSEMCHTNDTKEWSDYINCAIMRNMRMEYMIPKYPLHQISYFYPAYHGITVHRQGHFSTHAPGFGGK